MGIGGSVMKSLFNSDYQFSKQDLNRMMRIFPYQNLYGIDMPATSELIASNRTNEEVAKEIKEKSKLTTKTKLVSLLHISNTLGCCNPIKEITKLARDKGSLILLDACQSLAHQKLDIHELGIDFLAGSGHKLCGPTGIGFLWSKKEILEKIPPFFGGGEMIQDVFEEKSTWAELPHKFEAGTPAIAEAIGLAAAINYINNIGLDRISEYEKEITKYLFEKLRK